MLGVDEKKELNACGCIFWEHFFILLAIAAIQYRIDITNAYKRLDKYDLKAAYSSFGRMSYIDEGTGQAILISHGIFGGYDQAYVSLKRLVGADYRKISPSRFGYPGSDVRKKE